MSQGMCVGEAKQVRNIQKMTEHLAKTISVLREAVAHVKKSFEPAIRNVPTCAEESRPKGYAGNCELEVLIESVGGDIMKIAKELNSICERSAV